MSNAGASSPLIHRWERKKKAEPFHDSPSAVNNNSVITHLTYGEIPFPLTPYTGSSKITTVP
jgi:hypothetical protein